MTFYAFRLTQLQTTLYGNDDLLRRIIRAKTYIDRQYDNPVTLDTVASEACLSRFHFLRAFKFVYGQTPHQYIRTVRLAHACRLLKTGESVLAVCVAVGYSSPTTFSTLFKRQTGLPPARYRKKQL